MAESKKVTANDVIQKDLFKESTASAEKFLNVILKTEDAIIKLNKETTKQLAQVKKGETSAEIKKQNELLEQSAKQRKLLAEAKKLEAEATLAVTKAKTAEENQEKKTNAEKLKAIKVLEQENSVYAKKSKQLQELRKQYRDLALGEKKSADETKALKAQINALDKELKQVDADMGVFNRNVGDYKNQVKEALAETDLFSAGLGKLDNNTKAIIAGFGGIVNQLKKVKESEDVASSGADKLGKSLKATGIALVIAAIASLFSFFTTSREGALQFDLALNKVKGTLSGILGAASRFGSGLLDKFKALGLAAEGYYLKLSFEFEEADKKLAESAKLSEQANEKMSTSFDGTSDAISNQIDALDALSRKIFEYEDQIRVLQISLAKVKMDEEDLNEIYADQTIASSKQKAALEGAIKLRLEGAKISKDIADKELTIARDKFQISLRDAGVSEEQIALTQKLTEEQIFKSKITIKTSNDELNALQDKLLAQLNAADQLDDLARQDAQRQREFAQNQVIADIELIRSKKLGADAQVQLLTKQISDEKIQLEEREKLNEELRRRQLEAQDEEISKFEKVGIKKDQIQDLINTKNAVELAQKLELIRRDQASEAITTEIAKVVNEAQTNELAYNETKKKQQEEEIERIAKIKRLDQEIAIIRQQTQLQAISEVGADKAEKERLANELIFRNENVFNRNLVSLAQQASNERIAIAEEEARVKAELAEKQYQIDKENIEKTVNDEQIKAKELEKLAASYNQNVAKLASERSKTIDDLNKQIAERQAQILNKQTQLVVDSLNKTAQAFSQALDQRYAQQSDQQQRQIDKTNANIAKQQDLAQRGQKNQLAFEEERLAQQQLAQQDAAKKQAKIQDQLQTAEALLNAYNSELSQPGANPATAGARAIADVLLFKGLAKGIVQFAADGNNDIQGPGTTKSDSIPFMLSKHEGVVKAESNMGNPGVVKALNDGTFKDLYMPKYEAYSSKNTSGTAENIAASIKLMQSNNEVIKLLKDIKDKPVHTFDVNGTNEIIESVYKNGMKTVIKHQMKKPRI